MTDIKMNEITKSEWALLFNDIHPGFFDRDYVKKSAG